ncbi:serine/threonine-protein kinase [Kitasatospora sp. NPDC049258]|uniref:serine/threonine-protein kinase n=1 Tax=Kitasatospora sp. NPDC049258 TaxID=3155394 RepID=UPI0034182CFA
MRLTEYGWLDSPAWGQVLLPLLVAGVVARVLGLGLLRGSQRGHRFRLVSRERRREIRTRYAEDASQRQSALRQLNADWPPHRIASVAEPVLTALVLGGALVVVVAGSWVRQRTGLLGPSDWTAYYESPPWPASSALAALTGGAPGGPGAALLALALAALCLALWARTRFLVLCSRMPSGTWEHSAVRRYLVPLLAGALVLALALVPVAALAATALWQLCSLLQARALHHSPPVRTPPPLSGGPAGAKAPPGATRRTVDGIGERFEKARASRAARRVREERVQRARTAAAEAQALVDARDAEIAAMVLAQSQALREEARAAAGTAGAAAPPRPATAPDATAPDTTAPDTTERDRTATERDPGARDGQPAPVVPCEPLPPGAPTGIGSYRLLGLIGAGGMGTVYLARRQGSATQVALKTLHTDLLGDAELLRRFENEAAVLAQVPEAYTAKVLGSGVADGVPYIAMELLDGRPLGSHLRAHGTFGSGEALRALALALAVALDGLHGRGLVHRDLKPANIMMTTDGPKLLDFGIARMIDQTRITRTGGSIGTPAYMAPEQIRDGGIGPAADVWAWGCCVVAAAFGGSPFTAENLFAIYPKVLEQPPEPAALAAVRALDPALAAVVERALAKAPADRPADGAALLGLLRPGAAQGAIGSEIVLGWRTLRL